MKYYDKSIGPVLTFLFWIVLLVIVCLVGISDVFAATYDATSYTAQLYDNYGPTLYTVTTEFSNMSWRGTIPTITANTSGAAWGISSPIPLLANHTYSMTVKIDGTYGGDIVLSTYNRIGVGTSLSNAKSSYENNTNCTLNYSNSIASNMTLQFAFTPSINSNYIVFPFATTYTGNNQSFYLYDVIIDDLGSGGVSQTDINNSLNNQTNELNNSITNSTNTITGALTDTENNINSNIDDMEKSIVDSNKETQEVIKDQFNSCRDSYNLTSLNNFYINVADYYFINKKILDNFEKNTTYTISFDVDTSIVPFLFSVGYGNGSYQYDIIYKSNLYNGHLSLTFTTPDSSDFQDLFIRVPRYNSSVSFTANVSNIMLVKGSVEKDYEPYGEQICTNKIDDTNSKLDEQNETSKGILGKLKDLISYINPFSENFFVYKLIELLIDALKSLFIPEDNFFTEWWNDFKMYIDLKLGFLTTPFEIFINFINSYLDLSEDNIIIDIPEITVPNFEDHVIIEAQTFNWKELLESKTSLNTLWQLYLDFIDVYLILNFLGLCNNTYARIFGGDTSNYEYYTVEDSYYFDTSTGEVSNAGKHSERTVRRKKV